MAPIDDMDEPELRELAEQIKQCAYLVARSIAAMVRMSGMVAENHDRLIRGEMVAYTEEAFAEVAKECSFDPAAILKTTKG